MRLEQLDPAAAKGWYAGPWNSALPIGVGYANRGIDDPHLHTRLTEIYLVARGWSEIRVELETVRLAAGDVLVIEPGEAHTFLASSADYFHFVIQVPPGADDGHCPERIAVPRTRLGLWALG